MKFIKHNFDVYVFEDGFALGLFAKTKEGATEIKEVLSKNLECFDYLNDTNPQEIRSILARGGKPNEKED